MAEAETLVRAFDEAGNIGHDEGMGRVVIDFDHAKIWDKGCEGVVGDLRADGGDGGDEAGFADVGEADNADVGEELQFELDARGFAGVAVFRKAGSLVGGGGEVRVAATAFAAAGDDGLLAVAGEVGEHPAGVGIGGDGADGRFQDEIG